MPCPLCGRPIPYYPRRGKRQPRCCSKSCASQLWRREREPEGYVRPLPRIVVRHEWATRGQRLRWLLKQDMCLGWVELARKAKRAGYFSPTRCRRAVARALGELYANAPPPEW